MAKMKYRLLHDVEYYSPRYNRVVKLSKHDESDGATGAFDLDGNVECQEIKSGEIVFKSLGFWVHDELCNTGQFADGSKCSNWQASWILRDILKKEGHNFRRVSWLIMTFLFGGGVARDNGMFDA